MAPTGVCIREKINPSCKKLAMGLDWNVQNVAPLTVRCCNIKLIQERVGILVVTFTKHI